MLSRRPREFLLGKFEPSESIRNRFHCGVRQKAKDALVDFRALMERPPQEQQQKIFHENLLPVLKAFNLTCRKFRHKGLLSPENLSEMGFQLTFNSVRHNPTRFDKGQEYHFGLLAKLQKVQRKLKDKQHCETAPEKEG